MRGWTVYLFKLIIMPGNALYSYAWRILKIIGFFQKESHRYSMAFFFCKYSFT